MPSKKYICPESDITGSQFSVDYYCFPDAERELGVQKFKKVTQSILYLPHFCIMGGCCRNSDQYVFALQNGTINMLLQRLGFDAIPFLSEKGWWIFTYIVCHVWKEIGWGTIIYLAALLPGLMRAYMRRLIWTGASRFQRLIYNTAEH